MKCLCGSNTLPSPLANIAFEFLFSLLGTISWRSNIFHWTRGYIRVYEVNMGDRIPRKVRHFLYLIYVPRKRERERVLWLLYLLLCVCASAPATVLHGDSVPRQFTSSQRQMFRSDKRSGSKGESKIWGRNIVLFCKMNEWDNNNSRYSADFG